ncbi:MAG TPA: hypothetical protein VEU96_18845 [Bryobacteraceae bacterium]|nr:hypothetical protein [Bryobacteraceae bacterium]
MQPWTEDLSERGLDELVESQIENRAWGKELRRRTNDLVNSRLAKHITHADYVADRQLVHDDAAEYQRRAAILETQIVRRTVRPLVVGS